MNPASRSRTFLSSTVLIGIVLLFLFAISNFGLVPAEAAPPCGKPKTGPCPTATPGDPEPTATPEPEPTNTPTPEPTSTPGTGAYVLVWSDEFDGPNINPNNWSYDTGYGDSGWGNNELQWYTDKPANSRIENGHLVIEARAERFRGQRYTSARLKTQGLQSFAYGRIEAEIKIPYGVGIWPAFWMLGDDIGDVGWPQSGEIDIMENIGSEPATVHGALHGPGYAGADNVGGAYTLPSGNLSDDFHVYAVEWDVNEIRWYIDDINYPTTTVDDVPGEWVYDHPFFIILNIAVGGNWPGSPDETTTFPQFMEVDYVRVYQRQ